jgi:hypothetical protein
MGEAKRRKKLSARALEKHPFCCYCGGNEVATTIDHVPAKILFPNKRRPAGLEVPACGDCNRATSKFDQMAGVFSRVSKQDPPTTDRGEFRRLVRNVHKDFPEWAAEISGDTASWEASLQAIFGRDRNKVDAVTVGPITKLCFETMAAKFGFALHFDKTNKIVPPDGAVEVRFRTNMELYEQQLPDSLVRELGPPETLRQGAFNVGEYFSYRASWFPDGRAGIYVCKVGIAFTTIAIVLAGGDLAQKVRLERRFLPGDFKKELPEAIASLDKKYPAAPSPGNGENS